MGYAIISDVNYTEIKPPERGNLMIIDRLENSHKYNDSHKGFAKSFAFLQKAVAENLPVGRYEIDGDNVFAFIQEYKSKTESAFETHKNYIDIQFVDSGVEVIEVTDIANMKEAIPYSPEKDVTFYDDYDKATVAVIESGAYGIFFPWDAHKPGLAFKGNPDEVKKIVVKVKF